MSKSLEKRVRELEERLNRLEAYLDFPPADPYSFDELG